MQDDRGDLALDTFYRAHRNVSQHAYDVSSTTLGWDTYRDNREQSSPVRLHY